MTCRSGPAPEPSDAAHVDALAKRECRLYIWPGKGVLEDGRRRRRGKDQLLLMRQAAAETARASTPHRQQEHGLRVLGNVD